MKKFLPIFLTIFCFSFFINISKAQTTLAAGDIAFTGYINAATDEFSFVLVKDVTAGTLINFTDNGWLNTGSFRGGESTVTWQAPAGGFFAGTEIKIVGTTATLASGGGAAGSVSGIPLGLSTSGDQILAFQGTVALPTFICAIHMNVYATSILDPVNTDAATWDNTNSNTSNGSALPPGLTTGVNCIWVGELNNSASEFDNAVFNCTGVPGTPAQLRVAVNNSANWIKSNGAPVAPVVTPSGCSFLTPLPIKLIYFSGNLNSNRTADLQWEVDGSSSVKKFELEKSRDGLLFYSISDMQSNLPQQTKYAYIDQSLTDEITFYRLKMIEPSGDVTYSNIVAINLKAENGINIYPNPITNYFIIQQTNTVIARNAILVDGLGRALMTIVCDGFNKKINTSTLPPGVYILKFEDGRTFKIVKQ